MKTSEIILETTKQLLSLLSIPAEIEVRQEAEGLAVQINTQDSGLLIGYHGETLAALQFLLGQIVYKETGQWEKIYLNIADYWQKREDQLRSLADKLITEVKVGQKSVTMPYLSAKERKIIHLYLSEFKEVRSESVGEGRERRLVIFPNI